MRVPLSWLREYVDVPADATPEDVLAALVRVGFEEEDVHRFELQGPIVVGEVLEFVEEPQSNGKTIRWCQVRVAPDGEHGGRRRPGRARHRLRRTQLLRRRQGRRDPARVPCCPGRSRSRRARPTVTSRTA